MVLLEFAYFQSTKNGKGTSIWFCLISLKMLLFATCYIYQNTNVCSEIPFSKSFHHIETSRLICKTSQWTNFSMRRSFTERLFQTGINKQIKTKKKYLGKEIKIKMIVLKMCSKLNFNTILSWTFVAFL